MIDRLNSQTAPYPDALKALVDKLTYRPGWKPRLENIDRGQGSTGLTLIIRSLGYDTYHVDRGETYEVNHFSPVPPAAFDGRAWERWLLDQFLLIEAHEACEFFQIGGRRPFAPNHGPGRNPYSIIETGTDQDARTSFRGELAMAGEAEHGSGNGS